MSYEPKDYWEECLDIAADEIGLVLSREHIKELAQAVATSHENYGMAFYSPPASDRLNEIEREWKAKYERLQRYHDEFVRDATHAVRVALRQPSDVGISIGKNGEVTRSDGRTTVIQ